MLDAVTVGERLALRDALALLDGGFADYAEAILVAHAPAASAEARAKLARGDTHGAKAAIRDRIADDA